MSTTELIGVIETARLLRMSRSGVIAAANAGRIPAAGRIGQRRTFVFDRAVIDQLAREGEPMSQYTYPGGVFRDLISEFRETEQDMDAVRTILNAICLAPDDAETVLNDLARVLALFPDARADRIRIALSTGIDRLRFLADHDAARR